MQVLPVGYPGKDLKIWRILGVGIIFPDVRFTILSNKIDLISEKTLHLVYFTAVLIGYCDYLTAKK